MPAERQGSEVLHGFEAGVRAGMGLVQRARSLGLVLPREYFEEFIPHFLGELRAVADRGGEARLVIQGEGADPEVVAAAREAGVSVRVLGRGFDVALVVSEGGVLLVPPGQRPDSPLTPASLRLDDVLAVVHFRLAFERAWEAARPLPPGPLAARPPAAPGGAGELGRTRGGL